METKINLIKFYPYREWFWYYRKNKFIKGFTLRLLGINFMRKDKDSFEKLMKIWNNKKNEKEGCYKRRGLD
jgi:hypothetical protein